MTAGPRETPAPGVCTCGHDRDRHHVARGFYGEEPSFAECRDCGCRRFVGPSVSASTSVPVFLRQRRIDPVADAHLYGRDR